MAHTVKTTKNNRSVESFLDTISNVQQKEDSLELCGVMKEISGFAPRMWGEHIIGFGEYSYTYKSGRKGVWFKIGFAPRKKFLALYLMPGYQDYDVILQVLGAYTKGKCCIRIPSLDKIHMPTLHLLITQGYNDCKDSY